MGGRGLGDVAGHGCGPTVGMSFWLARPARGAGECEEACRGVKRAEGQGTKHRDGPRREAELKVRKGQGL